MCSYHHAEKFYIYVFNENSVEARSFSGKGEVPLPNAGQPLVMHAFPPLPEFKNRQLSP